MSEPALPAAAGLFSTFDRVGLESRARALAAQGVYVGTSSWKYPGWCGQIYDEQRYLTRGKFSQKRFEEQCLAEYAQTFSTVCVDAGYYQFPTRPYLETLCEAVPADFRFSFKVTDTITLKTFPNLPRHGRFAGQRNEHFLNADLFLGSFLATCKPFHEQIGVLIFEFSRFHKHDFAQGREFVEALDGFLAKLPRDWQYGVEIRNRNFLQPEYFETLQRHGVTHVFNSWTRMPPISEQLALPGSTTTDFYTARLLLKPGRTYEEAVAYFSPYTAVKEVNEEARTSGRTLIERAKLVRRRSYVYVNNRLEGNSLETVRALLAG